MQPASGPKPIVMVSDLHFGAHYAKAHPDREALFCRFLEGWQGRAEALYLLGDLFEFWMEYRTVVPKRHFAVLHALRNLADTGVAVHYLSGNHDFNLGLFFAEHVGLTVHTTPIEATLKGLRCLLLHGDGLAASDWRYRITKHVMRHPLANTLFKLVHPDAGIGLANYLSKLSRDSHDNRPRFMEEYVAAGKALLLRGYDAVVHGHTHCGFVRETPEGIYVNSGEWLERLEYLTLDSDGFHLHDYRESLGK
jgi:UDP-2,3-diacylglucosamine hydrolase